MIATESMRISFSDAPTGPCGSSTPPQPAKGNAKATAAMTPFLEFTTDHPLIESADKRRWLSILGALHRHYGRT
jgi:hypothetical protein